MKCALWFRWREQRTCCQVRWTITDGGAKYYVYRSQNVDGPFTNRITATPVTVGAFDDPNPPPGMNYYMVKAAKLVMDGSGSYTNLSQGIIGN